MSSGGASDKESACQSRKHKKSRFDLWVRKISWRGTWQHTPVLLPGESHGQRSLVGYNPWGRKGSDTTERLTLSLSFIFHHLIFNIPQKGYSQYKRKHISPLGSVIYQKYSFLLISRGFLSAHSTYYFQLLFGRNSKSSRACGLKLKHVAIPAMRLKKELYHLWECLNSKSSLTQ